MSDDDDDDDTSGSRKRKGPRCPFTEYYFEGERYYTAKNVIPALRCFNKALEMQPNDKRVLLARSKCYLYLGKNDKALDDVEQALAGDENDPEILYQKAQVFYMMGNFEYAAVFFQRGMQLRPQLKKFKYGLQKALYAIQSALGGNTRITLNSAQLEGLREKHRQAMRTKKFKEMATVGRLKKPAPPGAGFDVSPTPSMIHHITKDHKLREEGRLLGLVAKDKVYCRGLVNNKDLLQVESMHGREMSAVADAIVTFLDGRQEFWRQQKPVNLTGTRKELVARVHLKLRRTGGIVANMPAILRNVDSKLASLRQAEKENDWPQVVRLCQTLQGILLPVSDALWSQKSDLLCEIFASMGKACIKLAMYERGINCHKESLDLAVKGNLEDATEKALENLGNSYAVLKMYEKAIQMWQQWLKKCDDPLKKAWLLHEIGRCFLQINEALQARKYGRQAINVARGAKSDMWMLINTVLVSECEVVLGNFKASVALMAQAVKLAEKLELGPAVKMLQFVYQNVFDLMNDANIEMDDVQMTIFDISDEDKQGLFPKEVIDTLKSLKDFKKPKPPSEKTKSVSKSKSKSSSKVSSKSSKLSSSRGSTSTSKKRMATLPPEQDDPLWQEQIADFVKEKGVKALNPFVSVTSTLTKKKS